MRSLLLLCLLSVSSVRAGLMTPLSIEDMARQSQLIVRGTVISTNCQKDPEGRIFTKVELNLSEVWKGTPGSNPLKIVLGGGALGKERVLVADQVEYGVGEEVVGFFVLNQRGEAVTLGMCQGKFHVHRPDSGSAEVHNPFHGRPQINGASGRTALTLEALRGRVVNVK